MCIIVDLIIQTNIILISFVLVVSVIVSCLLLYRYIKRRNKIPLYIALTSICLWIPMILVILTLNQYGISGYTSDSITPLPFSYLNGTSFMITGLSSIFLYFLISSVFEVPSKFRILIIFGVLVPLLCFLTLTIIGSLFPTDSTVYGIYGLIFLIYTISLFIISIYEYLYIMLKTYRLFHREGIPKNGKAGFRNIFIYAFTATLFLPLFFFHLFLNVYGITYGLTWVLAGISAVFAYFGFLYPQERVH